jgi:hypothetical protein
VVDESRMLSLRGDCPESTWQRQHAGYFGAPWHFLNFLPESQGHKSLRPDPAYGLDDIFGMVFALAMMLAAGRPLRSSPTIAFMYGSVWAKYFLYPAHK